MDLMRARVALRERPLLDVFDLSLRFFAAHVPEYALVSCAVALPAFAMRLLAADGPVPLYAHGNELSARLRQLDHRPARA